MQRNVSTVPIQHRFFREIDMCLWSPMQRNVSTVPVHNKHTAKFTSVAAHRCNKSLDCTDSPWAHREFNMCCCSPMRKKRFDCTELPNAHRQIYTCCRSPMQRNVSTARTHHRHTGAATTLQNPFPLGVPAKTANSNDFCRREYELRSLFSGKPKGYGSYIKT